MYLKNFLYITALIFFETQCFKGVAPLDSRLLADNAGDQDPREQPVELIIIQVGPRDGTDSPPVDFAAIQEQERQQRISAHEERIQAFYVQQAQVSPQQLLANIKNAKEQLAILRKLKALSFAIYFFSEYIYFPEMLCFYAQLKYYQDVVQLLIQECLLPNDEGQQAIAARLKEFLFGQDPGWGSFDYDRDVATFSYRVRTCLKRDQQLCNRIDEMLTARGVDPRACLWSIDSQEQIDYNTYVRRMLAAYVPKVGCAIS